MAEIQPTPPPKNTDVEQTPSEAAQWYPLTSNWSAEGSYKETAWRHTDLPQSEQARTTIHTQHEAQKLFHGNKRGSKHLPLPPPILPSEDIPTSAKTIILKPDSTGFVAIDGTDGNDQIYLGRDSKTKDYFIKVNGQYYVLRKEDLPNIKTIQIRGGNGNDFISLSGGNFSQVDPNLHFEIFGGRGDDWLIGSEGNDFIKGGEGKDVIGGWGGNDTIDSREDPPLYTPMAGPSSAVNVAEKDLVVGGEGVDTVFVDNLDEVVDPTRKDHISRSTLLKA